MSHRVIAASNKCEQLQELCEQQRQQLTQQFAAIEMQLQTADMMVSMAGRVIKRPELWLAGLTGLWALKRTSLWSLIGQGWIIWSTAKRVMHWFKR